MQKKRTGVRRTLGLLATLTALGLLVALLGAGGAAAALPRALINADTVSGGSSSLEAQQATADGFAVDVVSGSTWAAMSQADFAQYQVLIVGDPTCGLLSSSVSSSAATWAPVVMGTAGGRTQPGNRILIGTDPVFHYTYSGRTGAAHLIGDGIAFAGALPGRTGLYLDDTCGDWGSSPGMLDILDMLSTGSGAWSENTGPPCGGSASLIASNSAFDELTSGDLQGWYCSIHESFPTYRSDWTPLAIATDAPSQPTCGTDVDTGLPACGEAYILISGSDIVVSAPHISISPLDATNPAGTDHTVTAHVTLADAPAPGQTVSFTVTGQNAGASGTCVPAGCVTDANGDVSFTYHDGNGAGDDTIIASFTGPGGTTEQASAAKHWVGVVEQPISATGTTISAVEGSPFSGVVATVSDPDTAATASEYSATIDWGDGSPSTSGALAGSGGSFTVSGSHTYADAGSYVVTVVVTDIDTPTNSASATTAATVADAPISASCAAAALSGQSFAGPVASLADGNPLGSAADFTVTIAWGDSSSSAGTVTGGGGSYTIAGSHAYAATGPYTVTTSISDVDGSTASASCSVLVYAGAPGGGAFVVGDRSATGAVTFWSSQWWKANSLSGGTAPAAFKGYALQPAAPACGSGWTTDPGNSAPPPAGPLPAYMAVIVASSSSKSGPTISGNTVHVVVVKTNAGYAPDPGHDGTGTVVATVC